LDSSLLHVRKSQKRVQENREAGDLPQTGDQGVYLKMQIKDKLIEHGQYIGRHGQDMPELRDWKWKGSH
jgi:phosphoketolase